MTPGTPDRAGAPTVCESRGCAKPAVAICYDDEHDLRPWMGCADHYLWLHGPREGVST